MSPLARNALLTLHHRAEARIAGVRQRDAALTERDLAEYRKLKSLQEKTLFETTMRAAAFGGAVTLENDPTRSGGEFLFRIEVASPDLLASFLGVTPAQKVVASARQNLSNLSRQFPILEDVFSNWARLKKARGLGPEDWRDLIDAARVIDYAREADKAVDRPLREVSTSLFNNSKHIEALTSALDVLLTGDLDASSRQKSELWQELGLYREERPVLLAGNVTIERLRVSAPLDTPYSGIRADSIRRIASRVSMVLTIENLTTFHSEAKRRCDDEEVLVIFTGGTPTPAWCEMYKRILASAQPMTAIFHWGDIDEGGFRIAAYLAALAKDAGHDLQPWRMHPDDVPIESRNAANSATLRRMKDFATKAGWGSLGDAIESAKIIVEQESFST